MFGQMAEHFPSTIPIGVRLDNGEVVLVPPPEYVMKGDDALIVVAEDR
jgi:hypothetical protein